MKVFTFVLFTTCAFAAVWAYSNPPDEDHDHTQDHFSDTGKHLSFRLKRSPLPQHDHDHDHFSDTGKHLSFRLKRSPLPQHEHDHNSDTGNHLSFRLKRSPLPQHDHDHDHFSEKETQPSFRLKRSPLPQHGFGHHGVLRGQGGNERGVERHRAYPGYSYNHHGGNAFNRGQQG